MSHNSQKIELWIPTYLHQIWLAVHRYVITRLLLTFQILQYIQCYAICFYCICFSVIKLCSYWKDLALNAIAEHGNFFYQATLNDGRKFTCDKLPSTINIYGANVDVVFGTEQQGTFSPTSISNKLVLERLILDNATENTGFLLWTSSCCLSCIF